MNDAYEELIGMIINADGVWEWDDTNQTDLPVGTGNLIEGQESYSFAAEYLKIKKMKVKDKGGLWRPLQQIDQSDPEFTEVTIESYFGLDSSGNPQKGLPLYYDILGDSFRLYPSPTSSAVTLTNGIKTEFVRTGILFTPVSTTAADTTAPGLPSTHHVLLAYKASLPYCMSYKKDRVPLYLSTIQKMESTLIKFYARRNSDRRNVITGRMINFR